MRQQLSKQEYLARIHRRPTLQGEGVKPKPARQLYAAPMFGTSPAVG